MIVGNDDGLIHYFENTATTGSLPTYVLSQPNYMGIDVGAFSTPILIDLNSPDFISVLQQNGTLQPKQNKTKKTIKNIFLKVKLFL